MYPTTSIKHNYSKELKNRLDLIAYSDGRKTLFEIARILKKPLKELNEEFKLLKKEKILSAKYI